MKRSAGRARVRAVPGPVRHLAGAAAAAVLLAGCSAGGAGGAGDSEAGSGSATATGSGSGTASGADPSASPTQEPFTEPGSELETGQPARLRWTPRPGVRAEIGLTVTALERTTFKQTFAGWRLGDKVRSRAPYFVRATVENLGQQPLGAFAVPLFGLDGRDDLVEATTFDSAFAPCTPAVLPKRLAPGAEVKVCLVVLVPDKGQLVGATFRPTDEADPITWTGPVTRYSPRRQRPGQQQGDRAGASGSADPTSDPTSDPTASPTAGGTAGATP